jgi:hypothetical protein
MLPAHTNVGRSGAAALASTTDMNIDGRSSDHGLEGDVCARVDLIRDESGLTEWNVPRRSTEL